jgi:metal-sulfur cluster biosynthetic enzyme
VAQLSEESIREALKSVIDPELFVNIVDLGLVYMVGIEQADGSANVTIEMKITRPACPAGPQLLAQSVEVKLVMDPPWTPDRMTEDAKDQLGIF